MPSDLITLREATLHFGHKVILDGINLKLNKGEKISLIGRNGEGKTTLLKILQGEMHIDSGDLILAQNLTVRSLIQEVPNNINQSVFNVVMQGLGALGELLSEYESLANQLAEKPNLATRFEQVQHQIDAQNGWQAQNQVHTILSKLQLNDTDAFEALSGGLKRRVLLAQALVAAPDILLLDEPTNHLDIESIQWLEEFLNTYPGCIVFITHDRAFLQKIANRVLELDRGELISFEGQYTKFLKFKEAMLETEARHNALFDKRLAQEEIWIRQGIKARRTRNEGRVLALKKMREQRMQRKTLSGKAKLNANLAERSGKLVIEAKHIGFQREKHWLFKDFSIDIMRGDKIGIIGPNGCGKTTLLNCLLNKLTPTTGHTKLGTKLEIAYFDQLKAELDPTQTVQENVGEGSDFIEINGNRKHIIGYLQDFLFSPDRARSTIAKLSGGERSRLLLAKLFSKPSNILILDEPTNDLDIETLELLEDLLTQYTGTILIVSHDRAFINNVVTSTLVFEPNACLTEYVGGYDDWLKQRKPIVPSVNIEKPKLKPAIPKTAPQKLSYREQERLKQLPKQIEQLEQQLEQIHTKMADPSFYQQSAEEIKSTQENLTEIEETLTQSYADWETLEAKNQKS